MTDTYDIGVDEAAVTSQDYSVISVFLKTKEHCKRVYTVPLTPYPSDFYETWERLQQHRPHIRPAALKL